MSGEQKAQIDLGAQNTVRDTSPAEANEAQRECMRMCEALIFAATEPLSEDEMVKRLPDGTNMNQILTFLKADYFSRGVNLTRVGKKWFFRTAPDLSWLLQRERIDTRKLSRAALETLAIIAYHQPVTRTEVEDIRGVAMSKGTMDVLLETGWVRVRGRRRAPGRPMTYGTTEKFLVNFTLEQISDLPGLDELKGAGLFDGRLPKGFGIPQPRDDSSLMEDEDPLGDEPPNALDGGDTPEADTGSR